MDKNQEIWRAIRSEAPTVYETATSIPSARKLIAAERHALTRRTLNGKHTAEMNFRWIRLGLLLKAIDARYAVPRRYR